MDPTKPTRKQSVVYILLHALVFAVIGKKLFDANQEEFHYGPDAEAKARAREEEKRQKARKWSLIAVVAGLSNRLVLWRLIRKFF